MKHTKDKSPKNVVIIGASSGIGKQIAIRYINRGWQVGIASRRENLLSELNAMAPERVFTAYVDVTQRGCENDIAQLIYTMGNHVDVYWHVAGVGKKNYDLSEGIEIQTADTNGTGFVRSVGVAYRHMVQQGGGHIAVMTSVAGTKGLGPAPAYSATKAMQTTYIQALEQLAHRQRNNIHFTDIRPGFVDTEFLSASSESYPLIMTAETVARKAVKAVDRRRHICVIDFRWKCLTAFWRRIPRWVWRRLKL